ncbi:MAG: hypothetical protein E7654_00070 [Ruminococcaceae bacterium]|nr:hypothetical protein [Oscillospiraceae bacterium]
MLQFFGCVGVFFAKNTPTVFLPVLIPPKEFPEFAERVSKKEFSTGKNGKKTVIFREKASFPHGFPHPVENFLGNFDAVQTIPSTFQNEKKSPQKWGFHGEKCARSPTWGNWDGKRKLLRKNSKRKAVPGHSFPFICGYGAADGA